MYSLSLHMPFVYSLSSCTSVIDFTREEEDNDDDDDCKMPASVESALKRKQPITKPAARVNSPGQDLEARVVGQSSNALDEGSPASQ